MLEPWTTASGAIALDHPRVMAIVNVTPDSFSDGGEHLDPAAAARFASRAAADGAALLDVGAESTRPGASRVDAAEQTRRLRPAIAAIRDAGVTLPISVDTTLAPVAEAALDAGASIINDVSGAADEPEDPSMLRLAAERGAGLILMHRLRPPDADRYSTGYRTPPVYEPDVVTVVRDALARARDRALDAGVDAGSLVLDPGLGFGKSVEDNLVLARACGDLQRALGRPLLSAGSRKSFLGAISGHDVPAARASASVALSVAHHAAGLRLFRVHDVRAHADALAVADRLGNAPGGPGRRGEE
jgi:dihydropteroate synthase